jgi:hypothetical protein
MVSKTPEVVAKFGETYGLAKKGVFGAGSGLLQDIVDAHTTLDISSSARRVFSQAIW